MKSTQRDREARRHHPDPDLDPRAAPGRAPLTEGLVRGDTVLSSGLIQRRAAADPAVGDVDAAAHSGVSGARSPLPHKEKLESAFGTSLDHIEFHAGSEAQAACADLSAHAYAVGNKIAAASEAPSEHLIAHEVAHTFQKQARPAMKSTVSAPGDALEEQADRAADAAVAGQRVDVGALATGASAGQIQRNAVGDKAYSYPRSTLTNNASNVAIDIGTSLYDAIMGTGAFDGVQTGSVLHSTLRNFCSPDQWVKPNGAKTQTVNALRMQHTGSWNVTITPKLSSVVHLGPGTKSTLAQASTTGTSSGSTMTNQSTYGAEAGGEVGGHEGAAKGGGKVSASNTTGTADAHGSALAGGTTATTEAENQRFVGVAEFDIHIEGGWEMPSTLAALAPGLWAFNELTGNMRVSKSTRYTASIQFQVPTGECYPQ